MNAQQKGILALFTCLDTVAFLRFMPQSLPFRTGQHFTAATIEIAQLTAWAAFPVIAYGLFRRSSWAFWGYYLHFPLRLLFLLLSFGFLTLLARPFHSSTIHTLCIGVAAILEVVRLVLTVRVHRACSSFQRLEMESAGSALPQSPDRAT